MTKRKRPDASDPGPDPLEKLREQIARLKAGDTPEQHGAVRDQTPEESARALLNEIKFNVAMSSGRAKSWGLPDTEPGIVREAFKQLQISFQYLAARIPKLNDADECFGLLEEVMRAAYTIGGLVVISPQAAKPYVVPELNRDQAERARAGKTEGKAILMQAVRDEVAIMSTKRKMAVSEPYARLIEPRVSKRLGRSVSLKTIQNYLSRIKTEQL